VGLLRTYKYHKNRNCDYGFRGFEISFASDPTKVGLILRKT